MDKKTLLLLSTLALNCQDQQLPRLEHLNVPKIEVEIPKILPEENSQKLEEKIPSGASCTVDLSNHFIPELLSLSRDADLYFSTEGSLQNPLQRERFGIFSSFAHHQKPFEHYAQALARRGNTPQPKIEAAFVPYISEKTVKKVSSLQQQLAEDQLSPQKREKIQKELETLQQQIHTIKDIQQILQWEGFYTKEIDGIYDAKTSAAVMGFQKYHLRRLINPVMAIKGGTYELKSDGSINKPTRELLNKDFEEYAFGGVHRVLEERVFHAKCNGRYPYVIEQAELHKLVDSAAEQLHLNTAEGLDEFFRAQPQAAIVYLEIPPRYQQDSMKLEVEVEKWDSGKYEKIRTKTNLRLYAIEEERVELFNTKAVVGGWVKSKKTGKKKQYVTPERKFYLKHITIMPLWNPPEWAAAEEEVEEEEKLPGPFNAFGMFNTPLYYDSKPQKDPFRGWQEGDNGYKIHPTPWPSSVENGGASHGCVRIHPNMSRFFYFVTGYTPHRIILENVKGRQTLKYTPLRGSYIPFEPENYIKVRTCEQQCE